MFEVIPYKVYKLLETIFLPEQNLVPSSVVSNNYQKKSGNTCSCKEIPLL